MKILMKEKQEGQSQKKEMWQWKQFGVMHVEDSGRVHKPRTANGPWKVYNTGK